MKTRQPLSEKQLHKLEETRDPWAEAIAGLKDYKRARIRLTAKVKVSPVVEARLKSGSPVTMSSASLFDARKSARADKHRQDDALRALHERALALISDQLRAVRALLAESVPHRH